MSETSESRLETSMSNVSCSASSEDAPSVSTSTTTNQKTELSKPTTLTKPSGLKPPTKIGRLCSNSAPKPAVPISPRSDGSSTDIQRKLSEESSRKHLSDLIEAEEDEVSSSLPERPRSYRKASTGSRSSVTSMDALWERHPRRLSEAGLRRSSDHSVVLTEDTDSFIIGERVWVGGTKPGQIAYIGETQFAPGEWAGIVLDDPIGKNDGSVAGVRYFQCPEKRGVFSRLTRLTREPLITHSPHDASPASDAGSVFERPPSGSARPRRTLSPNGSVRSIISSKMNASISTTTNGDFRLGDRVIVSSSRGSKAGTLRYVGVTEFASGVWAGVELDDPLGKNDGSVEGKRYFECSPRFGLFAPISKLSRSPSNRKPGACAIHSNGRATPLRRSNSRESLTSLGTSIASSRMGVRLGVTSLGTQELLREKQHHLERLMRERELERSEIAKVSLQAERAETALEQIRKDALQVNTENSKLKAERDKLTKMLEDERQKVEDLMFRNEEENINKEDYYKYRESMEQEKAAREKLIRDLEAEVALQTARADTTSSALREFEDQRNMEMATIIEQHKEELTAAQSKKLDANMALSTELQKLLDEAYSLLKEKESEKDSLGKSLSEELSKVKSESEKALNETRTKLAIVQTEFETQLSVLAAKLQLAESKLETEKQNVERLNKDNSQIILELNSKLASLQAAVDDKTLELNKVTGASKEHEVSLNKEITKLKMELSAKILDLEQLEDSKKKQDSTYKLLQNEFVRVKEELTNKINEYETFLNEASQQEEKNKLDILKLQQTLNDKTKEYEKLLNDSNKSSGTNEKLINEYKQTIHERDKEIIKLKDEFEETTANFNIKHSKIAEEHKKEIEDRNTKIEELIKEIESGKLALDQSKVELDTLNLQFTLNVDELTVLKEENKKLKEMINEMTEINVRFKDKISEMELEIGELNRQLISTSEKCSELQKSKEKIETEYMNLTGQTTDSNDQFNKLSQHLKDTEKELQELKDKYREATNNYGRLEQELKQQIFKIQEEFSLERSKLVDSVEEYLKKLGIAEGTIKEYESQNITTSNRLKELESQSDKLLDENTILKKEIETLKQKEQELSTEYDVLRKKIEIDIDRYKEEISMLKADGATSEVKLMEKVDQLTEAQNDLNNKLEEARKNEDSLQKVLLDMNTEYNNQKKQYEADISNLREQLAAAETNAKTFESEQSKLNTLVEEKQTCIKDLTLKLEMREIDSKSNAELLTEKNRQLEKANEDLCKATETKNKVEENLNNVLLESSNIKQQYVTLLNQSSAEETLVKEQLAKIETLTCEATVLLKENATLETRLSELSEEVVNLKNQLDGTKHKLNESVELCHNLKKLLEEKEGEIKVEVDKNIQNSEKNKQFLENSAKLQQEISLKDNLLHELQLQLNILNEALHSGTNEKQQVLELLQSENSSLKIKHVTEIESLNTTIKSLETQTKEQGDQLLELPIAKEKLCDLQKLLVKSESDIKQLSDINEAQKANYEDLNKQLQVQFDEYRKNTKAKKYELKTRLNDVEKELEESRQKISKEQESQNLLRSKLCEAEKTITDLSSKLELISVQQTGEEGKDERLEKLTLELQAARQSNADTIANNNNILNNLKADVEDKIKKLKDKDGIIIKLQDDLKNYKVKSEIAEREKALLQKEISNRGQDVKDKNDNTAMGLLGQGDTATQKLSEDKEMIDGQVSFLNSVIVDMQRKNEQLMARVQALEGVTVPVETTPMQNGRKARAVAPRLFCDICDEFDAHDTEDCPRQAPAPPPTRRAPPPPRPYCDICEAIGTESYRYRRTER